MAEAPLQMRPVPGFEGYYASNTGRIWSTREWRGERGRWLKGGVHSKRTGHLSVMLAGTHHLTHAVIALTFLGPRPEGLQVRHLDGDPTNNRITNLAYGTQTENAQDMLRHGTNYQASKTHCESGHPFDDANTYWRPKGGRSCRECSHLSDVRLREKRRNGRA